jgi:hypothetical protein
MPLNTVSVSRTFHLGDSNFFKLGQEGTIEEGETREELTKEAMNFIYATLEKYYPAVTAEQKSGDLPVIDYGDYK